MRLLHDTFIWMKIKYLKKNKKAQSLEILFIILVSLLYFSRFSTRAKRWEMTTRMDKLLSKRENKKCSVWPLFNGSRKLSSGNLSFLLFLKQEATAGENIKLWNLFEVRKSRTKVFFWFAWTQKKIFVF